MRSEAIKAWWSVMLVAAMAGTAKSRAIDTNDVRYQQWLWNYSQRAYPLGYIPSQAREQALARVQRATKVSLHALAADGAGPRWVNIGPAPIAAGQTVPPAPVSGRITCIAVDPNNSSHWLAGAAQGGVWETTDAGKTWVPKTDDQPSLAMGAVAFAPSNPAIMFAGTGEANSSDSYPGAGLLKSTDGGNTWQLLGAPSFAKTSFSAIRVDPANPDYLVVATAPDRSVALSWTGPPPAPIPVNGVYLSTDGGVSWTRKLTGPVVALETHPANFKNQYAAVADGNGGVEGSLHRSNDGGQTWTKITGPWAGKEAVRVSLSVSASNPDTLYACLAASRNALLGLWRTDNAWSATPTWVKLPDPSSAARKELGQMSYNFALSVDPANANVVYFAEVAVWKYDGKTWSTLAGHYDEQVNAIVIHPDQHVLVWAGNRLIVGNDGGVWSTTDGGATFLSHNTSLATIQFYHGSINALDPDRALGGEQDNGSSMWFGTNAWTMVGKGDGGDNAISAQNPNQNWLISFPQLGILRVTGGGQFQKQVTSQQNDALFIAPFAMCPQNENIVIAGSTRLWRSDNVFSSDSPTWKANTPQLSIQSELIRISAVAFAPSDNTGNTYAFGTVQGQLLTTSRGGSQGDDLNNWFEPDAMIPRRYVSALAFDPANPNILYATVSGFDEGTPSQPGHLFRTRNALSDSATWENIGPAVNLPHNCLAIDPRKPNTIYVGTDLGVWRTPDGGANWTHLGPESGMPNVSVSDLKVHPQTGRVFAFTHGRSAFILDPNVVSILPAITSFSPTNGVAGSRVTIRGAKFDGTTEVRFNGVASPSFTLVSSTNLSATVPTGATTGRIGVTTPNGSTTSSNNFVVLSGPAILDFAPKSGNVGTVVTITGVNLGGATSLAFAGVNAPTFTVVSSTQVTVTVPAGAGTGRITLTSPGGTGTSAEAFTVTDAPVISGFTPSRGGVGITVTITGANLAGVTSVQLNGLPAVFAVGGANQITVTVPPGAASGSWVLAAPAGTVTSDSVFVVVPAPVINGFSPASGGPGTPVTINGSNFTDAKAVKFNGLDAADFLLHSDSQITATAPPGLTAGTIRVDTPGGTAVSAGTFGVFPEPANDHFSAAQGINGNAGTATDNNVSATKDPGEPNHAGNEGGKSTWYRWVAPTSGLWTFDTRGSSFDTLLAVYVGTALGSLTEVASNDNAAGLLWSSVTFYATGGTTYWLAVDGRKAEEAELHGTTFPESGSAVLNWQPAVAPPPGIAGFSPDSGAVGSVVAISGTNFLGTVGVAFSGVTAPFEVVSATQITATVPAAAVSGPIKVTTPGGTVTSIDRFTVTVPPANDSFSSAQLLTGLAGAAVGSNVGATSEPGEPNHAGAAGGKSIWFVWTAPTNGTWTFDTRGSSYDTLLAIYAGDSLPALSAIASNDNSAGLLTSTLAFDARAGTTYHLAVDGKNDTAGALALNWTYVSAAPAIMSFTPTVGGPGTQVSITGSNLLSTIAVGFNGINTAAFTVDSSTHLTAMVPDGANTGPLTVTTPGGLATGPQLFTVSGAAVSNDDFANRLPLSGETNGVIGSNLNCGKEAAEPRHAGKFGGASVWWSWTAPRSATYKISTAGSDFDTVLAVYVGTSLASLLEVAANDDDPVIYPQSSVSFEARAGATYQIAVDGYNGAAGRVVLTLFPITPPQLIYLTGFEASEGYNWFFPLSGQNGWSSSGFGENGVVFDYFGDFSQQAYIGNSSVSPGSTLYLWQPLNYTPDTAVRPVVGFATYLEIVDSGNGHFDDFDWDVYNKDGKRLFLLNFDNSNLNIYYRSYTNAYQKTGFTFDNDTIYYLEVMMDFGRNRWSAYLDGDAIVTEQPLATGGAALNLGDIDARWVQRKNAYGDNAMVFDNYAVWAQVSPVPRVVMQPRTQAVTVGNTALLAASADSTVALSYQWLFNGVALAGATNQILDLGSVTFGDAGAYSVVVTNLAGVVTSQVAQVVVNPLPNLAPYRPEGWSGSLVVTSSPGSTTDAPVLHDTDDVYVDWAIVNSATGSDVGERFFNGLYLDDVLVNTWATSGLKAGVFAPVLSYHLGKLAPGLHSVAVRADLTSVVREQDKNDNIYSRSFSVTTTKPTAPVLGPAAIVQGTTLSIPIRATLGQRFQVLTSTDLAAWTTNSIITIANGDGTYGFAAPINLVERARFYQLRLLP